MGKSIRNLVAVTRVGLDLAKDAFQVHGIDTTAEAVAFGSPPRRLAARVSRIEGRRYSILLLWGYGGRRRIE